MSKLRLIARLDIKGPNLVKTVQLEGLRIVGDPQEHARRYYEEGADELIYIDIVASLYGRNSLRDIVERTAQRLFVPLTVGGGIRSVEDVRDLLRSGADKVAVNTAAVRRPELVSEIAQKFGSQCMVLSIEAKRKPGGGWEALTDGGREHSGVDAVEWARRGAELGAGEILLTSVDREGTRKGFDIELLSAISSSVSIPVICSGGFGVMAHLDEAVQKGQADAVAFADALHFKRITIPQIRAHALERGFSVRQV
jgi:cyclase